MQQRQDLPVGIVQFAIDFLPNVLMMPKFIEAMEAKVGGDLCICLPHQRFLGYANWTNESARNELEDISRQALLAELGGDQSQLERYEADRIKLYRWHLGSWVAL
jgi:hypothetical protein